LRILTPQEQIEEQLEALTTNESAQAAPVLDQDALIRYVQTAKDAKCPRDQIQRFIQAGIVLQEKQLQASAVARFCDYRCPECQALADRGQDTKDECPNCGPYELGYGGSRGGGKSFWLLAQMAEDCLRQPGIKCLLLRKVGKANRENFEDLRRKVLPQVPNEYKRQEGLLVFENGSRIILGHFHNESDIDAYLGLEYDVIGVEEATTLSLSKYKAVQTCNRTSTKGWKPRMYSTTNPGGIGHTWYKKRFILPHRLGREFSTRFIQATVDDNRCVNPEYRKVLNTLVGWQKRAWRFGDWDIAAGQFFTNFRHDVHVIEHASIAVNGFIPEHWRVWCSLDYGFVHYTTIYLFAEDDDGNIYIVDEHGERRWLPQRHAEAGEAMLWRNGVNPGRLWQFVAGHDAFAQKGNDGRSIADGYAEAGIYLTRANVDRINGANEILTRLGDPEVLDDDGMWKLPPRLFITDRCVHLIECLPSLEHDPHRPEDVLKVDCDEEGQGGDDWYDGARYGIMAHTMPPTGFAVAQKLPGTVVDRAYQVAATVEEPGALQLRESGPRLLHPGKNASHPKRYGRYGYSPLRFGR
jgi:phage terminase large subunit